MPHLMTKIRYEDLNARQQESYNFQKVSGMLADYGYTTIRLSDDWHGADFIAQHVDGMNFLKVQLKGRVVFDRKYVGRDLHICFRSEGVWYLYPHDILMEQVRAASSTIGNTASWLKGMYSFPSLTANLRTLLEPYRLEL